MNTKMHMAAGIRAALVLSPIAFGDGANTTTGSDIKPGNLIFRRQDNRLVSVDFGLAVGVEELGQTRVSGISILFAAPEQHYGEPATQAAWPRPHRSPGPAALTD